MIFYIRQDGRSEWERLGDNTLSVTKKLACQQARGRGWRKVQLGRSRHGEVIAFAERLTASGQHFWEAVE
jgi:hypothetical protein